LLAGPRLACPRLAFPRTRPVLGEPRLPSHTTPIVCPARRMAQGLGKQVTSPRASGAPASPEFASPPSTEFNPPLHFPTPHPRPTPHIPSSPMSPPTTTTSHRKAKGRCAALLRQHALHRCLHYVAIAGAPRPGRLARLVWSPVPGGGWRLNPRAPDHGPRTSGPGRQAGRQAGSGSGSRHQALCCDRPCLGRPCVLRLVKTTSRSGLQDPSAPCHLLAAALLVSPCFFATSAWSPSGKYKAQSRK
jgi:hypothetical protein